MTPPVSSRDRAVAMMMTAMPSTSTASFPHLNGLLDHFPWLVDEIRQHGGPEEEDCLHDPQREAGFQHSTCLVYVERQVIARLVSQSPERAQRHVQRV